MALVPLVKRSVLPGCHIAIETTDMNVSLSCLPLVNSCLFSNKTPISNGAFPTFESWFISLYDLL